MTVLEHSSRDISSGIDFDRYDIEVAVSPNASEVPPAMTFDECDFPEFLLRNIRRVGFAKPTPVQRRGFPLIQKGVNLLASSQSGSGKTATYLLPIIAALHKAVDDSLGLESGDPRALILVPTRELALQVERMANEFTPGSVLDVCVLCGGRKLKSQLEKLQAGCDILVATPGRLKHVLELPTEMISLSCVRHFVLDEADKLLGKQFKHEMEAINEDLQPKNHLQTILITRRFDQLSKLTLLSDFVVLELGAADGATSEVDIEHRKIIEKPLDALIDLLQKEVGKRTLIVAQNRTTVAHISEHLELNNVKSVFIHGLLDQDLREAAVDDFRSGEVEILVASGIMVMGLDVKHLGHVVDYNRRANVDDYVLRLDHTNDLVRSKITFFTFPRKLELPRPQAAKTVNVAENEFPRVTQIFLKPPQNKKEFLLRSHLLVPNARTLIFAQPTAVKDIVSNLKKNGVSTTLYSSLLHSKNLDHFKNHTKTTLVTSDPDVIEKLGNKVDRIFNFVLPPFEKYVKMANSVNSCGSVTSFYHSNRDKAMAGQLRRLILVTNQQLPPFLGGV